MNNTQPEQGKDPTSIKPLTTQYEQQTQPNNSTNKDTIQPQEKTLTENKEETQMDTQAQQQLDNVVQPKDTDPSSQAKNNKEEVQAIGDAMNDQLTLKAGQ
jgi:hypothetical protein